MAWKLVVIEWEFGSGKTGYAVWLCNKLQWKHVNIYSNIKLTSRIKNTHFSDPFDLESIIGKIEKLHLSERAKFSHLNDRTWIVYHEREKYTQTLLVIDEAGLLFNNRMFKDFDKDFPTFINQCRKYQVDIVLVSADGNQIDLNFRRYVSKWYQLTKIPYIGWLPVFQWFRVVKWVYKDNNWDILYKKIVKWDGTEYRVPQIFFKGLVFIAKTWKMYDDLHINKPIKKEEKESKNVRESPFKRASRQLKEG